MRFLVDAQLPAAMARWLAANGHDAQHVADVGLSSAADSLIWQYAAGQNSIIVTKDEDFAQRRILSPHGPSILWLRVRNTRKRELLSRFASQLPQVVASFERGETLVEMI